MCYFLQKHIESESWTMKVNDKIRITAAKMKQKTNCEIHLDVPTKEIYALKELQTVPVLNVWNHPDSAHCGV
jgi:hypothetical protein